jgi:hypothetical protein
LLLKGESDFVGIALHAGHNDVVGGDARVNQYRRTRVEDGDLDDGCATLIRDALDMRACILEKRCHPRY